MLKLILKGIVVPKARPKFNRGQAYLPSNYRIWREQAIVELLQQRQEVGIKYPVEVPIKLHITYKGCGNADADNIAGAIMDALKYAKIVKDDNLKHISELTVKFIKAKRREAETIIEIAQSYP